MERGGDGWREGQTDRWTGGGEAGRVGEWVGVRERGTGRGKDRERGGDRQGERERDGEKSRGGLVTREAASNLLCFSIASHCLCSVCAASLMMTECYV